MKILLLLASVFMWFSFPAWADDYLNAEIGKIENPDPHIIVGIKKMNSDIFMAIAANPGQMQYVQIIKVLDSTACVSNFYSEEITKEKYKNVISYLEPKFQKFDAILKNYEEETEFKDRLIQYKKILPKLPKNLVCHPELQ